MANPVAQALRSVGRLMWPAGSDRGVSAPVRKGPLFDQFFGLTYSDTSELRDDFQGHNAAYGESIWAYRSIDARAKALQSVPVRLYRETPPRGSKPADRTEIHAHPVLDLLRRPSPLTRMTWNGLVDGLERLLCLHGEAYWLLEGDKGPTEIYLLSSQRLQPIPDAKSFIRGYELRLNDTDAVEIPRERVVPFLYWNPETPFHGMAPVTAARTAINFDRYAMSWNMAFMRNSGRPDGMLSVDGQLGDGEDKRIAREWKDAFGSAKNAHRVAVMEAGLTYTQLSLAPKDAEWIAARRDNRAEITAVWGVPQVVAGATEAANYATADQQWKQFWGQTMTGEMTGIVDVLNTYLLPFFASREPAGTRLILEFDTSQVQALKDNENERVDRTLKAVGIPFITPNEARNEFGLPSIGPAGDLLWAPLTFQPISNMIAPEPGRDPNPPAEPGGPNYTDDTLPPAADPDLPEAPPAAGKVVRLRAAPQILRLRPPLLRTAPEFGSDAHTRADLRHQRRTQPSEKALHAAVRGLFQRQADAVLADFTRTADPQSRKTSFDPQAFLQHWNEVWAKTIKPFMSQAAEDGGDDALDDLAIDEPFTLSAARVQAYLTGQAKKLAGQVNQTTRDDIETALKAGAEAGEGTEAIAARVRAVFEDADSARSHTIARTAVNGAYNRGAIEGYRQSNVVEGKGWMATLDDRTREAHAEAHGQEVGLDEPFSVDDEDLDAPGDPNGSAENIVNCRCAVYPTLKDRNDDGEDRADE